MKKIFYRVDKSDTISSISAKFSLPISVVLKDNNLKSEVCEGDLLVINAREGRRYTVKALEDFCDIAKAFNVDEKRLVEINCTPYVYVGMTILLE